ncbi:MAG TPA: hypothetical protein VGK34_07610 [Armatimonadota bacterium]
MDRYDRKVQAERVLSKTFWSSLIRWDTIENFRKIGEIGLPFASDVIVDQNAIHFEMLASKGIINDVDVPELIDQRNKRCLNGAQSSIDAASLIFAHTILDGAAYDLGRVCMIASPSDWACRLDSRKVTLGDTKTGTYFDMLESTLNKYLIDEFERFSLLKKLTLLCETCKPPSGWLPPEFVGVYNYDVDTLRLIDDTRHNVVHGRDLFAGLEKIESDLFYMRMTQLYMLKLVERHCGLKVNPVHFLPDNATITDQCES